MAQGLMRVQGVQAWALGSAGLMVIGAFGPWAKVLGMSVSGTDGRNDGWMLAAFAAIAALLSFARSTSKTTGFWLVLAGLAGAGITLYDRNQFSAAISQAGPLGQALAQVGWGLNLAMLASISLTISGITWLIRTPDGTNSAEERPQQFPLPATAPAAPAAGWYKDPDNPLMLRYWTGAVWTTNTAKPAG
jgi:hypothetical protein